MKKDKKGELTTKQIVTLIVLITSFIIILFLIFRLNLGQTTDAEICHNSVVLKGKTPLSGPLDCKTQYVCISREGDCMDFSATEKISVENREEIMKAIADKMASCWNTFGEGKIDYADADAFEKVACSICSITGFDNALKEEQPISYKEFYDYLKNTKKTNFQTYLQYIYSTDTLEDFGEEFNPNSYFDNILRFDKKYFILTGLAEEGILTPRWKIWDTKFTPQPVVILENTEENYNLVGCDEFLTKA